MSSVEHEIRQFIIDSFLFGDDQKSPSPDESLLDLGIVDSTGVLELVAFLERKYAIKIHGNELVPANLDSLSKLSDFIARKTAVSA